MNFISVRELNAKPREVWKKLKDGEMVITSNGKPVALLSAVTEETLEKTIKTIRRSRAILAMEEMQKKSMGTGLDRLPDEDIDSEIRAARKGRRP
jgi:prevent-host-death family protein